MRKITFAIALVVLTACSLFATATVQAQSGPTLFIQATDNFGTALTAAMMRKHVPAIVVDDQTKAQYILKAAPVYSKDESGAGKIARCMFADCIGMNGFSSVSVELVRSKDSGIVWAYQVRKANSGPVGIQSLSEAIAKHLKNDYLAKHREEAEAWHP